MTMTTPALTPWGNDASLPHLLPVTELTTPVARTTRLAVRLAYSPRQAHRALTRATTTHLWSGCSSYALLPDDGGIVVWAIPCGGFADPEATYLGTILFAPSREEGGRPGVAIEVVGLIVAPPYSLADLLAHVTALFGAPASPFLGRPHGYRH